MEFSIDKKGEGYRRDQVDDYVRELRQEYRKISEAYGELLRQRDAVATALVRAEMTAQGIVAAAEAQAEQIRYAAYQPYAGVPATMAWN